MQRPCCWLWTADCVKEKRRQKMVLPAPNHAYSCTCTWGWLCGTPFFPCPPRATETILFPCCTDRAAYCPAENNEQPSAKCLWTVIKLKSVLPMIKLREQNIKTKKSFVTMKRSYSCVCVYCMSFQRCVYTKQNGLFDQLTYFQNLLWGRTHTERG